MAKISLGIVAAAALITALWLKFGDIVPQSIFVGLIMAMLVGLVYQSTRLYLNVQEQVVEIEAKKADIEIRRLEASKIHAANSAIVHQGQLVQLQPGAFGYGVSTIHSLHQANQYPQVAASVLPELPTTEVKPLTLTEAINLLPRNRLQLCFGVDQAGKPVIADLYSTMHTMLAASTGMGKSSLLAGLLAQLVVTNDSTKFGLFLADVKRTTGRWFEGQPGVKVAYTLTDIIRMVGNVNTEMKRRMERLLTDEKPIILCIEEALVTRKMFAKFEDKGATLKLFSSLMDEICLLGRKFGIYCYWASQVDYADATINDIKGQFAARLAGSLQPSAAAAMGFQNKELIKQLWEERTPGRFLIESPSGSKLITTPRLNLKGGELASILL
ncbi:MAG: FtsK/SpoIIIE domain-containing protein, partial [Chloroflexota bacterium]